MFAATRKIKHMLNYITYIKVSINMKKNAVESWIFSFNSELLQDIF